MGNMYSYHPDLQMRDVVPKFSGSHGEYMYFVQMWQYNAPIKVPKAEGNKVPRQYYWKLYKQMESAHYDTPYKV